MRAKVLETFKDKYTGELHEKGSTITVSKERLEEILVVGPLVRAIKPTKKNNVEKETNHG